MKLALALLLAGLPAAVTASSQPPTVSPQEALRAVSAQAQVLEPSLMEALVTVERPELAGLFAFIQQEAAPLAFADFLIRDHAALKRFVRKAEKDAKSFGGIADWEKRTFLFLVGINASGQMSGGAAGVPRKMMSRVNELSLKPAMSYDELAQRRQGRG